MKWPSWITNSKMTDSLPGKKLTVFKMNQARFGVLICWENLFPDLFREMTAQGVDFMVSMTNETFVDIPSAHYQMLAINVFRAIENRVAILRITPSGVSAIIWPSGRITAMVQDHNSNNLNVKGYVVGQIPLSLKTTLYTRYGDWFVYCLFAIIAGFAIVPVFRKAHTLKVVNP
jgi:apolipoprotein N-acyltransferase